MNIVPMRDLKDTVKIESLCAETKEPVFVTKNGYGRLVIMDIECFENLLNDIYEAKLINEGLDELDKNKVNKGIDTINMLKKKYGI